MFPSLKVSKICLLLALLSRSSSSCYASKFIRYNDSTNNRRQHESANNHSSVRDSFMVSIWTLTRNGEHTNKGQGGQYEDASSKMNHGVYRRGERPDNETPILLFQLEFVFGMSNTRTKFIPKPFSYSCIGGSGRRRAMIYHFESRGKCD